MLGPEARALDGHHGTVIDPMSEREVVMALGDETAVAAQGRIVTPFIRLAIFWVFEKSASGSASSTRKLASEPSRNDPIRRFGEIMAGVTSLHILSSSRLLNTP